MAGEIKGRKDISNTWESWMPTVSGHLTALRNGYPSAYIGVFMTIFTEEMIEGKSAKNHEWRDGFKQLHERGLLDFAINLSLLAVNDESTYSRFQELILAVLDDHREA